MTMEMIGDASMLRWFLPHWQPADPRASILERYPNAESYVEAVRAASRQLVEERYMLEEDLERCVDWAKDWDRLRHRIRLP